MKSFQWSLVMKKDTFYFILILYFLMSNMHIAPSFNYLNNNLLFDNL